MVEHSLAKADTGVRFPSFAPVKSKSLYEKVNGVNLRRFRLAPFFLFSLNYEIYAILFLKGHRKNS